MLITCQKLCWNENPAGHGFCMLKYVTLSYCLTGTLTTGSASVSERRLLMREDPKHASGTVYSEDADGAPGDAESPREYSQNTATTIDHEILNIFFVLRLKFGHDFNRDMDSVFLNSLAKLLDSDQKANGNSRPSSKAVQHTSFGSRGRSVLSHSTLEMKRRRFPLLRNTPNTLGRASNGDADQTKIDIFEGTHHHLHLVSTMKPDDVSKTTHKEFVHRYERPESTKNVSGGRSMAVSPQFHSQPHREKHWD